MGHLHLDEPIYLTQLRYFLPSQAPLKDFVHHNTLHHYQNVSFKQAIERYFEDLGVKNIFDIQIYLDRYKQGAISNEAIESSLGIVSVLSSIVSAFLCCFTYDDWISYYSYFLGGRFNIYPSSRGRAFIGHADSSNINY